MEYQSKNPELDKLIQEINTLTTLNLVKNNIGADGARALASALEKNSTLTDLCLECIERNWDLYQKIKACVTENANRKLQENLEGVKEAIQNSTDVDPHAKQNLQYVVQDVQDMAMSTQLHRQTENHPCWKTWRSWRRRWRRGGTV